MIYFYDIVKGLNAPISFEDLNVVDINHST